jgi:hypothetical protein
MSRNSDTNTIKKIPGHIDSIAPKKTEEYKELLRKANIYEVTTEKKLQEINFYKTEAMLFLDSATKVTKMAIQDRSSSKQYITTINLLYEKSSNMANEADSVYKVAIIYKDSANKYSKEAEVLNRSIIEEHKPALITTVESNKDVSNTVEAEKSVTTVETNKPFQRKDSTTSEIYVIQLGAGNMDKKYFEKAGSDLEVITCRDGIKRYIIGKFKNKEDALEYRKKLIDMGFEKPFIRTLNSLK